VTFFIERKFESLSVEVLLLAHEAHLQKFQKHGFSNSLTINYTQTNLNFSLAYGFDGYNVLNKALQPNSENFSSNSRGGFGHGGNFNHGDQGGGGLNHKERFVDFQCHFI